MHFKSRKYICLIPFSFAGAMSKSLEARINLGEKSNGKKRVKYDTEAEKNEDTTHGEARNFKNDVEVCPKKELVCRGLQLIK